MIKSADSRTVFDARQIREDILKIEHEMAEASFWENRGRAAEKSQELAALKREVQRIDALTSEVKTLDELLQIAEGEDAMKKEIESRARILERDVQALENELFFSGKYDKGSATLSVYAGAGGKDAAAPRPGALPTPTWKSTVKGGWKLRPSRSSMTTRT